METPLIGIIRWADEASEARAAVRNLAASLLGDSSQGILHAPLGERPRLMTRDGANCGYVSLSHTRAGGAAAVSPSPIGVDLEWRSRRVRWAALARAHFAQTEQDWLASRPLPERKAAFLGLWTLKEAWLKAQGLGVWRLGGAVFTPVGDGGWTIPGEGWRGECRFLDEELIAAAIWRASEAREPHWLDIHAERWREVEFKGRWQAWSVV